MMKSTYLDMMFSWSERDKERKRETETVELITKKIYKQNKIDKEEKGVNEKMDNKKEKYMISP